MGRPATLGNNPIAVNLRLSRAQEIAIRKASRKSGKQKSEWMRMVLFDAAQTA
jgi:hypothetical protein